MSNRGSPNPDALPDGFVRRGEVDIEEGIAHDYSTSDRGIVPLNRRRPLWHLGGMWLTFQSGFWVLFIGFSLHNAGYSLLASIGIVGLAAGTYTVYGIFVAYLGSRTGQTSALLTRATLGRTGSILVSIFLVIGPIGWVGYQANLLAEIWNGLFGWAPILVIGMVLAVVMIFNNLFGFTGISAIARYAITPLMILWVIFLVVKGVMEGPTFLSATPKDIAPISFWLAVGTVIGFATWGNEPDLFRYSKPRFWSASLVYIFGFTVGLVLMSAGGWIVAQVSNNANFGPAIRSITDFSLFGAFAFAGILALAGQVAVNDGNYYEAVNAVQNMVGGWRRWRRWYSCALLALAGALAAWIVPYVFTSGFMKVGAFQAITLPCAMLIVATDHFLLPRLFKISRPLTTVPSWAETARVNWPGVVALVVAVVAGGFASGLIGNPNTYLGYVVLETWVLATVLYVVGVWVTLHLNVDVKSMLGFTREAAAADIRPGQVVDLATEAGL